MLTVVSISFIFILQKVEALEKLCNKVHIWYKALIGNIKHSSMESIHVLFSEVAQVHMDWVSSEVATEGLLTLLVKL